MSIIINKSPVDQFTLVHAGAGYFAHEYGLTFGQTLLAGIFWDYLLEPALKTDHPEWFPYPSPDAPVHAAIDAVTPAVAWWLTDQLKQRRER